MAVILLCRKFFGCWKEIEKRAAQVEPCVLTCGETTTKAERVVVGGFCSWIRTMVAGAVEFHFFSHTILYSSSSCQLWRRWAALAYTPYALSSEWCIIVCLGKNVWAQEYARLYSTLRAMQRDEIPFRKLSLRFFSIYFKSRKFALSFFIPPFFFPWTPFWYSR